MDINAGRLVTADVRVCGHSPSIASVYPAKYKAKGFQLWVRGDFKREENIGRGKVTDERNNGLARLTKTHLRSVVMNINGTCLSP